MTRSVEELRRESERSRAELAATVDRLKESITGAAEDIRHKVSPQHIKSEVSDFVGQKAKTWVSDLKERALENPIQAIAAGAAITLPLMRVVRGVPLPLLMIGAGLSLTSKTVRARVQEVVDPLKDKAGQVMDGTRTGAQAYQDGVQQTVSSVRDQAAGLAGDAVGGLNKKATQAFDALADIASGSADVARSSFERLRGATKETVDTAREKVQQGPSMARDVISDNTVLIGGLGIAIGAVIAAALPSTDAETKVMGQASDGIKRAAGEATSSGFEAVKDAALSAADAAVSSISEADLGKHASRMTEDVAERLKEAADGIVTAAFDPNRNSNI
jgi:hypothetical protein